MHTLFVLLGSPIAIRNLISTGSFSHHTNLPASVFAKKNLTTAQKMMSSCHFSTVNI
jgi:hypothetical protein